MGGSPTRGGADGAVPPRRPGQPPPPRAEPRQVSPARPRPRALRYRPARRTDVENLAELGTLAYRVSSLEKRREFYTDHPRFDLRDVRVGELDGRIVASLVLYPFHAWVRGQKLRLTGIGSVAG